MMPPPQLHSLRRTKSIWKHRAQKPTADVCVYYYPLDVCTTTRLLYITVSKHCLKIYHENSSKLCLILRARTPLTFGGGVLLGWPHKASFSKGGFFFSPSHNSPDCSCTRCGERHKVIITIHRQQTSSSNQSEAIFPLFLCVAPPTLSPGHAISQHHDDGHPLRSQPEPPSNSSRVCRTKQNSNVIKK